MRFPEEKTASVSLSMKKNCKYQVKYESSYEKTYSRYDGKTNHEQHKSKFFTEKL
jgi:ABC-type uncharacterized transport system substrate-binding protein